MKTARHQSSDVSGLTQGVHVTNPVTSLVYHVPVPGTCLAKALADVRIPIAALPRPPQPNSKRRTP